MSALSPFAIAVRRRRNAARLVLASLVAAYCLALSGCDKCGDWFGQGSAKSCHDESQAK